MKKLTILLTMLMATSAWAEEDEFPMKFTCELGGDITYVYIDEDISKSWVQFHPSSGSHTFSFWGTEKTFFKCPKHCSIEENKIKLGRSPFNRPVYILINRFTGKASLNEVSGQCYKGFKEYKKRKF